MPIKGYHWFYWPLTSLAFLTVTCCRVWFISKSQKSKWKGKCYPQFCVLISDWRNTKKLKAYSTDLVNSPISEASIAIFNNPMCPLDANGNGYLSRNLSSRTLSRENDQLSTSSATKYCCNLNWLFVKCQKICLNYKKRWAIHGGHYVSQHEVQDIDLKN